MSRRSTEAVDQLVREGEVLDGKYRVDAIIGSGGMGVVVSATHVELGQRVALKFLHEETQASRDATERFRREAQAAARLTSDHAVRVFDVGRLPSGAPYMVMELLDGIDLGKLLDSRGGKLPVDEAVEYVLQACEAIAEAHAAGIVHRDLKPQNLFLARKTSGQRLVKVLDFGISKMKEKAGEQELTSTNAVMGSPSYMSPEQIRSSRDVDERTDIWALGVILYRFVSGQLPFVGDTATQLAARILEDTPVPLRVLRAHLPDGFEEIVSRCLTKQPALRFASVAELVRVLTPFRALASPARVVLSGASPSDRVRPSEDRLVPDGTTGAWADTVLDPRGRRWGRAALAATVVLVACGALLAVARYRSSGVPRASAATPATAVSSTPEEPKKIAEPPPIVPTAAAASSSPPVLSSPPSPPAAPRAVRGRPSAPVLDAGVSPPSTPPPPTAGANDFPALRK